MNLSVSDDRCFHCGLDNPAKPFVVKFEQQRRNTCCPGCQSVMTAIIDAGMGDYYLHRTEFAVSANEQRDPVLEQLSLYDDAELQRDFVDIDGEYCSVQLSVEHLTCPACAWLIERRLGRESSIQSITVNVSANRAYLTWDASQQSLSDILKLLSSLGYPALPFQPEQQEELYQKNNKRFLKKLAVAGVLTMQVMMIAFGFYFDYLGNIDPVMATYFQYVSLFLATPVVFYSGSQFHLSAFYALRARSVNMDVPVSFAVLATYLASIKSIVLQTGELYLESICMFVFFLLSSRYLEHRARHKSIEIAGNLLTQQPVSARLIVADNEIHDIPAKKVVSGQCLRVKAGELIPVDGRITHGFGQVNESLLNGEFEPKSCTVGSPVAGGSTLIDGVIDIEATANYADSAVQKILKLQQVAFNDKPKINLLIDNIARYFVIAVIIIATLSFIAWYQIDSERAFWISISILVATCPCALGLATPSALTHAVNCLNHLGAIVKRSEVIQTLATAQHWVFDKTGTLTEGKFSIAHQHWLDPVGSERQLAAKAALLRLESQSSHPLAAAFNQGPIAGQRSETEHSADANAAVVERFQILPGLGISGVINGVEAQVTAFRRKALELSAEQTSKLPSLPPDVVLTINHEERAYFWLTDTIKPDAKATLSELHHRLHLTLLSGDSQKNVAQLAAELSLSQSVAEQTPESKLAWIKTTQQKESLVMVGDGVNDAPVLAQADGSIAVGNAAQLSKMSADIILLRSELRLLPLLRQKSKDTMRIIKQNMAWAIGYNLSVLPFAIAGFLEPWMAALGMSLSSVIVVYNSTRIKAV